VADDTVNQGASVTQERSVNVANKGVSVIPSVSGGQTFNILAEDGSPITTEAGDRILTESAA
jgi:hypothetical protein